MTNKSNYNHNLQIIGSIIEEHRKGLMLKDNSREGFIHYATEIGYLNEKWISVKTLSNIELGKNMPTLPTLKKLSIALDFDFVELVKEIAPYIDIE